MTTATPRKPCLLPEGLLPRKTFRTGQPIGKVVVLFSGSPSSAVFYGIFQARLGVSLSLLKTLNILSGSKASPKAMPKRTATEIMFSSPEVKESPLVNQPNFKSTFSFRGGTGSSPKPSVYSVMCWSLRRTIRNHDRP